MRGRARAAALPALLLAGAAHAAEGATPPRARYQLLVATWEAAHGRPDAAAEAARTALLHDPPAAAPRLLLATLPTSAPVAPAERLRLLEEAARSPGAGAAVWQALGVERARAGSPAAEAAFAEAEARGGGSATYAAWLPTLPAAARHAVEARWLAVAEPGPGGRALRATLVEPGTPAETGALCTDALAAVALAEPIEAAVVAQRCGPAGRTADARRALAVLAARGAAVADAEAVLGAWAGSK